MSAFFTKKALHVQGGASSGVMESVLVVFGLKSDSRQHQLLVHSVMSVRVTRIYANQSDLHIALPPWHHQKVNKQYDDIGVGGRDF